MIHGLKKTQSPAFTGWPAIFHVFGSFSVPSVGGVSRGLAKEALRLAAYKLPIKTQFVAREEAVADEGHAAAV